jgi:DnaJ-class molecular chaperone
MASRDYYVVLGVRRSATPGEIRSAYRELAKQLHPDRTGDDGTRPFQELGEAYATLSDPGRRRVYDREHEARPSAPPGPPATEPLAREPLSILHGEARYRPSWEGMRDRFVRNFTGVGIPKGEAAQGLNLEVILSTEEAARGVSLPLEVPTFETCPFCGGTGHDWEFTCGYCGGDGVTEHGRPVQLRIPPLVAPGSLYEIPLDGLGVHNFYLRVHVFVDDRVTT